MNLLHGAWSQKVLTSSALPTRPRREPKPDRKPEPKPDQTPEPAGPRAERWAAATAPPEEPRLDDLQRIQGIGPKTAVALRRNGITTYDDLALASEITLRDALLDAGVRPSTALPSWNRQAQYLADGDEAGFAAVASAVEVRDAP